MGKTFEALERYFKEQNRSAESRGLRQASRDGRSEDSSIPDESNPGRIKNRDLMMSVVPGDQVSQDERNLLYYLSTEDESEGYDADRLGNLPLKVTHPDHRYTPQLKISYRNHSNPNQIIVNQNPDNLIGRIELYELKNLFAKQIVLNLKSGVIQSIIKYKYFLVLHDYLRYAGGELLKFENGCFYRLNFKSKAMLSILLDRKGDLVNFVQQSKKSAARRNKHMVPSNILNAPRVKQLELILVRNIFMAADLDAIKKALIAIFDLTFDDEIECREGNIVVLNGQVAYEILVNLKLGFSIFMDKNGDFLDVSAVDDLNVWEKVIRDYSIHQNWLPSINLFKNAPSNRSTVQLAQNRP